MNLSFDIVTIHGSNAESTWNELRTRPGIIPVLLGDRREADSTLELLRQSSETFDEIKEAGLALDVKQWIAEQIELDPEQYTFDEATDDDVESTTCFTPAFDLLTGPPRTKEEAEQLAIEQYIYCTDIVDQGVGTLGNLQATLIDSSNGYFWWD